MIILLAPRFHLLNLTGFPTSLNLHHVLSKWNQRPSLKSQKRLKNQKHLKNQDCREDGIKALWTKISKNSSVLVKKCFGKYVTIIL